MLTGDRPTLAAPANPSADTRRQHDARIPDLKFGMTDPAGVANNSYSKVRDTINGEIAVWACEGIEPALGTSGFTVLGIAAMAPHPNAAKLYIRFTLTAEGSEPWNVVGDWLGRTDLPAPEGAPSFADANLWPDDGLLMFQIGSQVRDFWTLNALGGQ
jgi:iron(III) transport system substrate-binding protein